VTKEKVKIHFLGGAGDVTGSNFLFETTTLPKNLRFLIDCGMFQGARVNDPRNSKPFEFDPSLIDALFVTHSHIDHVGRIPKLVRDGFRGVIYSTPPTMELSLAMLMDSLGVLTKEAKKHGEEVFYEEKDVLAAVALWKPLEYHQMLNIGPLGIELLDSGHVLGSAMVAFHYNGKKIVFTGDLGNTPTPLLRDTEVLREVDYLIMESVYGDRNHENKALRKERLENAIEDTFKAGGTLLIPAFSLERTQEILFEIERMMEQSRIPLVPVYVDSPLAIKIIDIYKKYQDYFNKDILDLVKSGNRILEFPQVQLTLETEDSKKIDESDLPKIIIAGAGMSNGGRIVHHEKRFLPDPRTTLLLVGYQSPGTMGRRLQEGEKRVTMYGESVEVRAKVVSIGGYSAHKDSDSLLEWVGVSVDSLKKVFVVLGEPKSASFLVQRIRDYLGVSATAPSRGDSVEIEL
jgi:metallo-beta-lactamase family protein